MQTSQFRTCKNCNLIQELEDKLELKLWELAEMKLVALKYNIDIKDLQDTTSNLLHYKRILSRRIYNASYPCGSYSLQDIAKKLLGRLHTTKKCMCFSQPPPVSTTTSTTTTSTTTT